MSLKTVEPGLLSTSKSANFIPTDYAKENLIYMTWCGHYFCNNEYDKDRQYFPDNLLLYLRSGRMAIKYMGNNYTLNKGDLLLINCTNPHCYKAINDIDFVYLHYNGSSSYAMTDYLINLNGGPIFQYDSNTHIGREMYENALRHADGSIQNPMHTHFWISSLLDQIHRSMVTPVEQGTTIDMLVQYIQQHVGDDISLQELADMAGYSTFYLSHYFKKQTGYSPSEYIQSTRIEKARHLLWYTNKTIEDIAYEVGYEHSSSFIYAFTKKQECSPKQYRKMHRSQRL